MRAFFSAVFEKAGTTIAVGAILAILAALAAAFSGGQLIEWMGGVSTREFSKQFGAELEARAKADKGLAGSSELTTAVTALETRIAELERKLKALQDTSQASDRQAEEILAELKQNLADMTDLFDGAARIVYFRQDIAFCADGGCGTPLPSNFPAQHVKLGVDGSRTWPFEIGAAQNLREPFSILTSWSKVIENEFVGLGGTTAKIDVKLEERDDAIDITVNTLPYDGETYMVIQVHYLVAIEDSISLSGE